MKSCRKMGWLVLAVVSFLVWGGNDVAFAEPTVSFSKWLKEVKFSGDLRLRQEYFDRKTDGQIDRSRQRFRLRINSDWMLPSNWMVRFAVASGTGEQVSTNQSFDNLGSEKEIWIDKAYAAWQPCREAKLTGGKMDSPLWRPYTADLLWDVDFNPEGFGQNVETKIGSVKIFVNALQMSVDEDSGANTATGEKADQWEFSEQAGVETRLLGATIKAAAANHYWKNENQGTLSQVTINDGNRRTAGGVLLNNFNVNEYSGEVSLTVCRLPVSLQGSIINNRGARSDLGSRLNDGYQAGTIVGKAKERNTWEAAYFNKWLQQDATVADVADADFGDGGTNRKGHIYWVAFAPHNWMVIQLKHYDVDVLTRSETPSVGAGTANLGEKIRRTQFDVVLKF
jgi:hypothetical protein